MMDVTYMNERTTFVLSYAYADMLYVASLSSVSNERILWGCSTVQVLRFSVDSIFWPSEWGVMSSSLFLSKHINVSSEDATFPC